MRIYRHEVPVDDQWHPIETAMNPLSVGCRDLDIVEFWSWEPHDGPWAERFFRVFGTGQEIPDNVKYWGTAVSPGGALVWHLVEALEKIDRQ